ncbi:hypothetical protein OG395_53825 [Streptomyces sp. NBC_01320]|nr:hypothetical protein OG395_01525 [Streptomyces sp. NBC_01320]WSK00991.1 hypothetical protein OG395_53825 [Streptomyces sp. NBC_01320]
MRYPDGGGLTAEQRKRREEVRMRAVDLFEEDAKVPCNARELRALVGEEVVDNLLRLARLAAAAIRTTVRTAVRTAVDVAAAALEITAIVSVHHGGRFRHRHLLAEARRYLTRTLHGHPAPPLTDTAVTAAAIRDHCIPGDPSNPDKSIPLAYRTFTPAWAPKSPRSSTTPAAHRIHHRARAEAAQPLLAPKRNSARLYGSKSTPRRRHHSNCCLPPRARHPAGEASEPHQVSQAATDATPRSCAGE